MDIAYVTINAKVNFRNINKGITQLCVKYQSNYSTMSNNERNSEILYRVSPFIKKNYTSITFSISDPVYRG